MDKRLETQMDYESLPRGKVLEEYELKFYERFET